MNVIVLPPRKRPGALVIRKKVHADYTSYCFKYYIYIKACSAKFEVCKN